MTAPLVSLGDRIERMIAIQCAAYPSSWTAVEKREAALWHLFGKVEA